MVKPKKCKTRKEANKYFNNNKRPGVDLGIYKYRRGRVYKFVVCSYLEWINELF